MPALPVVPLTVRVDLAHSFGGDPHLTSRAFFRYTGGAPSNADCATFASQISSAWATDCAPMASSIVSLTEVIVTDLASSSGGQGNHTATHAGTRSGQNLTVNDCANINFTIGRRYRGGKPRMYTPWGVTADLATDQTWGGSFISAVESAWSAMQVAISSMSSGTTQLTNQANVSYYSGFASVQNPVTMRWRNIPTPRATAQIDAIISNICSPYVGSQRRRTRA